MRVTTAVLPRLSLCLLAVLAGCASTGKAPEPTPNGPVSFADEVTRTAKIANNGAHTTSVTQFQKFLWFVSPYRPDIQQGNFISAEQFNQLKTGMTRDQVKFIMGTSLAADIFHRDRWEYPFYLLRGNGELTTSRVTIYFTDDKISKIEGGNLPSEREYIERLAGPPKKFGNPND
ncbi:outer membrane protein assembly factor BamE [Massilia sp. TS11]|uniref:outer membrane protein assembly factor BamE n=1 Tax=Massilia sp. TS11 TaxID=2908003 RepID=UPI001EDBC380|nr:outer membrane protein assembly factor BamE [Massilia sp. TS11]MCG2586381.1 outer membrane protein assembly factor BamE [Massilia sp. TS11]